MIARLAGRLHSAAADSCIVDVGGVGYRVQCSARTLGALPPAGEAVELVIETRVQDDQIRLFGFRGEPERQCFNLLQTVQGVGAKLALGLLAVPRLLRTTKLKEQLFRSLLLLASTAFNFLALRHLRLDMHVLVCLSAAGAAAIGQWAEAAAVAFLFAVAHRLEAWSLERARDALASVAEIVLISGTLRVCRDPDDDKILETAIEGKAGAVLAQAAAGRRDRPAP